MVSKSSIKFVQSLKLKKYRQKYNLFVVEGEKSVRSLLSQDVSSLHQLYAISTWLDSIDTRVNPRLVQSCTKEELKKLSLLTNPTDVLALWKMPEFDPNGLQKAKKVIYLDDVQDPGNMGSVIRIADWYGVDYVVRSVDSADFFNPKVVQATMGSISHVGLLTIAKEAFGAAFFDFHKIGADLNGSTSIEATAERLCLVIGNEGHGIAPSILTALDERIQIAGAHNRTAESLNAAVASGILSHMIFGESL